MTQDKPWWAIPGAPVRKATIQAETVRCPVCGELDESGVLELYFPEPPPGGLLGMILNCGHVLDGGEWEPAVGRDDVITEGYFPDPIEPLGRYPVTIVDQKSGAADMIPLRVVDDPQ